jgi:hypothetical protein
MSLPRELWIKILKIKEENFKKYLLENGVSCYGCDELELEIYSKICYYCNETYCIHCCNNYECYCESIDVCYRCENENSEMIIAFNCTTFENCKDCGEPFKCPE